MVLDQDAIARGQSKAGGWYRIQLSLILVSWPPRRGWRKRAVGSIIPDDDYDLFVALKDRHLKKK